MLEQYHELSRLSLGERDFYLKPGVRGYPGLPEVTAIFSDGLPHTGRPLLDATGSAGAAALIALASNSSGSEVIEPSMAALRCAELTHASSGVPVRAGLPWDLPEGSAAQIALAPPADRGNARVLAELRAGARALRPDGRLYLALHKDQGAKRYQKSVAELFGEVRVLARERGWRLVEARQPVPHTTPVDEPWRSFEAEGLRLETLPGVHSAGRLDPGTALLISTVDWKGLAGREVLDLGCGSGILALLAARAGGRVTAVDDDLAAVVSTRHNVERLGMPVAVKHSDVDSALSGMRFDVVLSNPPFHVGRGVRLAVPEAFMAASRRLLRPGGELWLVANRQLPYERALGEWDSWERASEEKGFKVLRARR